MVLGLPAVLHDLPEPAQAERDALGPLQAALAYRFARPQLLRCALTLGSWVNEHQRSGWVDNACLEFLGDAVLDLVCAQALWVRFAEADEGVLTRLRATLVSESGLSGVARTLELGRYLYVGRGDGEKGARSRAATLSDALESVLAAVFLDAQASKGDPLGASSAVFHTLFGGRVAQMQLDDGIDAKSKLQQLVQARFRVTPTYEVVDQPDEGQPGQWTARVVAQLYEARGPVELGVGRGPSLKLAQRAAATEALRGDALL